MNLQPTFSNDPGKAGINPPNQLLGQGLENCHGRACLDLRICITSTTVPSRFARMDCFPWLAFNQSLSRSYLVVSNNIIALRGSCQRKLMRTR